MNIKGLQTALKQTGRYHGAIDGIYGPVTGAAVQLAMTDGPDTKLSDQDFIDSAGRLGCSVAAIHAITQVESSGAGFAGGRPVLLFEGHRFSRATKHQYDKDHPTISYPTWDRSKYPPTQEGRYAQLIAAVGLDVDAGFASASYGRFQILGENFACCGYTSSYEFAVAQAFDERTQLTSFENFVKANHALLAALRGLDWPTVALNYNGTGYAQNHYDSKLAAAALQYA